MQGYLWYKQINIVNWVLSRSEEHIKWITKYFFTHAALVIYPTNVTSIRWCWPPPLIYIVNLYLQIYSLTDFFIEDIFLLKAGLFLFFALPPTLSLCLCFSVTFMKVLWLNYRWSQDMENSAVRLTTTVTWNQACEPLLTCDLVHPELISHQR